MILKWLINLIGLEDVCCLFDLSFGLSLLWYLIHHLIFNENFLGFKK